MTMIINKYINLPYLAIKELIEQIKLFYIFLLIGPIFQRPLLAPWLWQDKVRHDLLIDNNKNPFYSIFSFFKLVLLKSIYKLIYLISLVQPREVYLSFVTSLWASTNLCMFMVVEWKELVGSISFVISLVFLVFLIYMWKLNNVSINSISI